MKEKQKIENNPLKEDLEHILAHTKGLWEELRGKKIFITGGTGFFGCWFLESFAWANEKLNLKSSMLVLTRNVEDFRKRAPHLTDKPFISFHTGDVRSFDFPKGKFDYIIHAAASLNSPRNERDSLEIFDIIVEGTRRVLEFAGKCKIKKFLMVSSGAIYGKQPAEIARIGEDYQGAPEPVDWRSAYSEGKRAAELLTALKAREYGFEAKIPRCFAFVGPYQRLDEQWAIGNFIRDGLNGGPIVVKGDGTAVRSYLYAADLTIFLWTIFLKGKSCLPYNVGSEEEINIRSLAEMISLILNIKKDIVISKKPDIKIEIDRYVPSTKLAREKLNLKQRIKLHDAIKKTIKYLKYKERK
ncbi:MAG: NAD-dependent epimerase/dehydratase family protein [Syntrophaceae bacterium]|nr:NAD-dependent epimerase/dehydratase family protein [Syntrophaceae bacterium]